MTEAKIKTKFGNATLCSDGYYHITSRKEGNNGKKVSRLVFEDFYKIKLPKHIQIHHVDGNRTNDNIWNLIPMTAKEHTTLHNNKREYTEDFKINVSKTKNNTGFLRVSKHTVNKDAMMGFRWKYNVQNNNESTIIVSASLVDLKEKVLANGLEWKVINEELAEQTRQEAREYYKRIIDGHSSGIINVHKQIDPTCKQGFIWQYLYYDENKKRKLLCSVNLDKLKTRVLAKGLEWVTYADEMEKVATL